MVRHDMYFFYGYKMEEDEDPRSGLMEELVTKIPDLRDYIYDGKVSSRWTRTDLETHWELQLPDKGGPVSIGMFQKNNGTWVYYFAIRETFRYCNGDMDRWFPLTLPVVDTARWDTLLQTTLTKHELPQENAFRGKRPKSPQFWVFWPYSEYGAWGWFFYGHTFFWKPADFIPHFVKAPLDVRDTDSWYDRFAYEDLEDIPLDNSLILGVEEHPTDNPLELLFYLGIKESARRLEECNSFNLPNADTSKWDAALLTTCKTNRLRLEGNPQYHVILDYHR